MFEPPKHNPMRHRYTQYKDRKKVAAWVVNFKDVFDMKLLYLLAHEWLVDEGWAPRLDQEFPEIYYLHREVAGFGTENWIRWRCCKTPEGSKGGQPLFQFEMDTEFHVLGLQKTEMVMNGKKVKLDKGEVEIRINAGLVYDKSGFMEKSLLTRPFKKMWYKRVFKDRWISLKKELYHDSYRYREALNTYLQIEKIRSDVELGEFWRTRTEVE
ncbi:hypothetical protein KY329_00865 [Candidatus Woesearchaeota archaeon]|nr:hypothetical protein [Candidatus Woesearchaeota archaeon]